MMTDNTITMTRSPNQVFLLLVGLSGDGKSSTVDCLFGTNVGETKKFRSQEHSTVEYTVNLKSNECGIPDQLSIINTHEFCDVDDPEQNDKNIMSVKNFLESILYMNNWFPNLVMIILNITDNRITGHHSNFAKMLKGISNINAIDESNHNVVVVLTHAMGIARDPNIWEETVKTKKTQVQDMVKKYLRINAEIVVQENKPTNNNLEHDGKWYLLPNGDKQPKILYQACKRILSKANDQKGYEAVKLLCSSTGMNKNVSMGRILSSSGVRIEETRDVRSKSVVTSEVCSKLETYKNLQKAKELINDISFVQSKFRDLGISKISDLQNMSMTTLLHSLGPTRITDDMQRVLQEAFDFSTDSSSTESSNEKTHLTSIPKERLCCFHEDSHVMLQNQKQKRMKDISVGEKILTANSYGRLTQDEVIAWLHQVRDGQFTFLQIVHDLGSITLSPEHILFLGNARHPKHASSLGPGDELIFFSDENDRQTFTIVNVLSIHTVKGKGIYAPLTYSGRLMVDKVDVSCYSSLNPLQIVGKDIISSHALAHVGFLPLRIAYKLGFNISYSQFDDGTGIHSYARWLMHIVMRK